MEGLFFGLYVGLSVKLVAPRGFEPVLTVRHALS